MAAIPTNSYGLADEYEAQQARTRTLVIYVAVMIACMILGAIATYQYDRSHGYVNTGYSKIEERNELLTTRRINQLGLELRRHGITIPPPLPESAYARADADDPIPGYGK